MPFYRKKPVIVEAIRYTEDNIDELVAWGAPVCMMNDELVIQTLEDGVKGQVSHAASVGDYIVKGTAGEFYPVKDYIWPNLYETEPITNPSEQAKITQDHHDTI